MERNVIINSCPRSGATVYLEQYYRQQGWHVFDEPWGQGRQDECEKLYSCTTGPIAVKHHPCSQNIPKDFNIDGWHMITYVRRNLLEQTLSYALARDKVDKLDTQNKHDFRKYFKPGEHESIRWCVDTRIFERSIVEMLNMYDKLLNFPRNEIVFYEECTFSADQFKQKHKSKTIANRPELEAIWWRKFSTTQPHLSSVDPNS